MVDIKKIGSSIIAEAKRIRKAHPNMEWRTAMKQAGVEYRKKHGTKKSGTKKRKTKKSKK